MPYRENGKKLFQCMMEVLKMMAVDTVFLKIEKSNNYYLKKKSKSNTSSNYSKNQVLSFQEKSLIFLQTINSSLV